MTGTETPSLIFKGFVLVCVLTYAVLTGDDATVATVVGAALGYGLREGEHQAFRGQSQQLPPHPQPEQPPPFPSTNRQPDDTRKR